MKIDSISKAESATKAFLETIKAVKKRAENDKYTFITGNKETAACRRASMDLTRALAEMRKP